MARIPGLFAAISIAILAAAPALAQVPHVLGFQGRLLRADGTAQSGTATVTFGVYPAETGGSALWTESQTLGLSEGYYSTFLGLVASPPEGLFDGPARWLEIRVGAETLSPRQQIGTVAYALAAQSVNGGSANVTSLKVSGQTVVDGTGRLAGNARYTAGQGISVDAAMQTIALQTCPAGQILQRDDSAWRCAAPSAGTVTSVSAGGPLSVANAASAPVLTISQAGASANGYLSSADWNAFAAKYDASTQCGGDLSGALAAPVVARLQSRTVSATAPSFGQVLKWTGTQWEPQPDANSGGTLTALVGVAPLTVWGGTTDPNISMAVANASADGYLSSADWVRFDAKYEASTQCGGDLSGALSTPLVAKLRGVPVASTVPSSSQVLRFDGSRWAPASLGIADVGDLSPGYLDLSGAQTVGGAKTFSVAPSFGTPLAVASGGIGTAVAAANAVFAGPACGADAAPSFRALDAADIPSLDAGRIGTGTLGVGRGGTGSASLAAGGVLYGNDAGALGAAVGTAGRVLVSGGAGAPSWTDSPVLSGANFTAIPKSAVTGLDTDLAARPTGGGTAGYLARWNGASALGASSAVYDTGTSVGIGTTDPGSYRLFVSGGPVGTTGYLYAGGKDAWYNGNLIAVDSTGPRLTFDVPGVKSFAIEESVAGDLLFDGGTLAIKGVSDAGRVGIGTTSPLSRLSIADSGAVALDLISGGSQDLVITGSSLNNRIDSRRTNPLHFQINSVTKMTVDGTGNVGVGTTSPGSLLEVFGPGKRLMVSDGTNMLGLGQWDGATNRIESVGRGLLLTSYAGTVGIGLSGSTTLTVGGTHVGIGTTSPGSIGDGDAPRVLQVQGTGSNGWGIVELTMDTTGARTAGGLVFGSTGLTNADKRLAAVYGVKTDSATTGGTGDMVFGTWNAGTYGEKARILANGNVGVGTASPGFKLDVAGGLSADLAYSSQIIKRAMAAPAFFLLANSAVSCSSGSLYSAAAGPNGNIDWNKVQFSNGISGASLGDQNGNAICAWYGKTCVADRTIQARAVGGGQVVFGQTDYGCGKGWGTAWPGWGWYNESAGSYWAPGGYWTTFACCQ